MREKITQNRALSLLLALFLVLAITIPVSADAYKTQGGELTIFMSSPTDITYDPEKTTDEYYYNVVNTPFLAGSPVVFKIAAGNAGGINNNQTLFDRNINVYSSTDFSASPVLTDADCSITSTGNSSWPDATTSVGRTGRTFTISIADEKLPDGQTYYLVINDVGSVGNAGSGTVGKKIVFEFRVAEPTTSVLSVSLDVESLLFDGIGTTYTLKNEILPTTAANKNVSYKSSDPSVAEVSDAGLITAKSAGTATITVTTEDGEKTDTCKVEVKDSGNSRVFRDASDYQELANGSCLYKFTSPKVMRDVKTGRFLAVDLKGVPTFSLESTASGGKQSASWKIHLYSDASLTDLAESKNPSGSPSFTYKPEASLPEPGTYYMVVEADSVSSGNCGQIGEQIIVEFPVGDAQPVVHTHTEEVVKGKAATCTEKGLTDGKKCSVCGEVLEAQKEIPAKGHTKEEVKGKAATCTEKGLTDGKKCSVCGEVLEAQKEIPALGHDYKDGKCIRCSAEDPDYKPTPEEPDEPTPVEPATKFTGLANEADKDGVWWYYTDGEIDKTHTGVDQNKYGWWRVENGKVNFKAQGIYKNAYGWWKTTDGKVTFKENSIYQNQYGWWKCKDSKVDFSAQSIYQNQYGWWKTTDGKVTFKENGLFKNQYGTWKVENSKVNFNYNGTYQGKTIKNGKVQ